MPVSSRTARIVIFGDEDAEEERFESAFFRTRQIELSILVPLTDVSAMIENTVDRVDVSVENERAVVESARPVRHGCSGERRNHHIIEYFHE